MARARTSLNSEDQTPRRQFQNAFSDGSLPSWGSLLGGLGAGKLSDRPANRQCWLSMRMAPGTSRRSVPFPGQQVKSGVHGIPAPIGQDGTLNTKPRETETASALAGEGPEGAAEGNLAASTRTVVGNHPLQDVGSHEAQVPTAREP